ncbi:MAG: hypothetical protein IJW49_03525, partial [Clostridia bacterium]|nr:hypothetical protein [Clostridia bacterium]
YIKALLIRRLTPSPSPLEKAFKNQPHAQAHYLKNTYKLVGTGVKHLRSKVCVACNCRLVLKRTDLMR